MDFSKINGQTPINDASGLIPTHINTQKELNEWESNNILTATKKYLSRKNNYVITIPWLKKVHYDMFNETWEWAGEFRKENLNIGVEFHKIIENIKQLTDNIQFWAKNPESPGILEQSIRIHYKLVYIHPFKNGNGRHARLVSDTFLFNNNHPLPVWPGKKIVEATNIREEYISALVNADKGNYDSLLNFTGKLMPKNK